MTKPTQKDPIQLDAFDFNGEQKFSLESIESRKAVIEYYAKAEDSIFYFSHSGGKDSMSAYEEMIKIVPPEKRVVIHATLGKYEHNGVIKHIEDNIEEELVVVQNELRGLLDDVLLRGKWWSSLYRFCTSGQRLALSLNLYVLI